MKIQILTQGIKRKDVMQQGLAMAKNYASTIGLNFEYSFKETNKQFSTQSYEQEVIVNDKGDKGFVTKTYVKPQEILDEADTSNKIVCLLHNVAGTTNPFQHDTQKNGCIAIQIPENWWVTFPETLADFFLHEIDHSGYFFKDGNHNNDLTHNQHSYPEWTNKQAHEYYLWLLQGLKQYLETPQTASYPTLRIRSTNKVAVRELQTLLNYWGAKLVVDGDFGNSTVNAVIAFQKSKNLVADGIVGNKTWVELKKKQ